MPTLLTATEAADFLRIHKQRLYMMTASGRLPCYRIGRSLRFTEDQLLEYLRAAEQMPSNIGETPCKTESTQDRIHHSGGAATSKAAKRLGNRLGLG
jgi:excisionase family DNA binding protein